MLQRLIVAAAWSCLAFIIYATLSSIEARPVIAGGFFTVIERFGAFAVLGFVFCLAYPRNLMFVCIMVFGSAVTLELLQNLIPHRDARLLDAVEKLLGGAAGIVLAILQSSVWGKPAAANSRPQRD
jgi:VanZ family protein